MLRSLFSGISGLRAHQTMLDVTGNNIANVNTTGFKASQVQFQDTLSQVLTNAGAAQNGVGGTNPAQVGLGVRVAGITTNFQQGAAQLTNRSTDMMISGDGFFVVRKGNEQMYTRAGAFDFDANAAYQFGDTDLTRRVGFLGLGREDIDISAFGVDVRAGYTFDAGWQPRVFANFAWYEGDDEDLAFNRLFSDLEYSVFLDNVNANLTDVFVYALGVQVMPTEAVALKLVGTYFDGDENWDEIGWEVGLCGAYNYSEDLTFRAGYNHFFADDDFVDDADFDYAFVETEIAF